MMSAETRRIIADLDARDRKLAELARAYVFEDIKAVESGDSRDADELRDLLFELVQNGG